MSTTAPKFSPDTFVRTVSGPHREKVADLLETYYREGMLRFENVPAEPEKNWPEHIEVYCDTAIAGNDFKSEVWGFILGVLRYLEDKTPHNWG